MLQNATFSCTAYLCAISQLSKLAVSYAIASVLLALTTDKGPLFSTLAVEGLSVWSLIKNFKLNFHLSGINPISFYLYVTLYVPFYQLINAVLDIHPARLSTVAGLLRQPDLFI